jgi:hypothetical protein
LKQYKKDGVKRLNGLPVNIDSAKLFFMSDHFSKIGRNRERGDLTRRGFTIEEKQAHELAATYMKQSGLSVTVFNILFLRMPNDEEK